MFSIGTVSAVDLSGKIKVDIMYFTWIPEIDNDWLMRCICNVVLDGSCIKTKYRKMRLIVCDNGFLSDDIKNRCYDMFGLVLKRKRVFTMLVLKFKERNFVFRNSHDLLLNPLNDSKCVSIRRRDIVWRFTRHDILNMFRSKLMSCAFQIPRINLIANPYTNEVFTKTELYNLYIGISNHNVKYWFIREFARLDFDDVTFLSEHRSYLYKNAAKEDICEMDEENFRDSCEYLMRRFVGGRFVSHGYFFVGLSCVSITNLRSIFTPLLIRDTESYRESNGNFVFIMNGLCSFIETYPWVYKNVMKAGKRAQCLKGDIIRECMKNARPLDIR